MELIRRGYLSPMRNCIFFIDLCHLIFAIWSSILGLFESFCNNEIFVKLNLPVFSVLVTKWELFPRKPSKMGMKIDQNSSRWVFRKFRAAYPRHPQTRVTPPPGEKLSCKISFRIPILVICITNAMYMLFQFDLSCDREPYNYLATSLIFISWAIGAVILGWLTDR